MKYKTQGTCSSAIDIEVENGIITSVAFTGGCNGNLKGISSLVKGMKVEDAIERGYVRKTTFEKMFDKKIPTAIFKGQPLKVPEGYSRGGYGAECDVLFSEDKFPEEERYIFSQFINRYELEKNQLAAIENFILD